jgi:hypothetical protein
MNARIFAAILLATLPTASSAAEFVLDITAPVAIKTADIDTDGRVDVVVSSGSFVTILSRTSADAAPLAFATSLKLNVTGFNNVVEIADINGDGKPDLVGLDGAAAVNIFLRNSADGVPPTFLALQSLALPAGSNPRQVAIVDINGDGKLDIITNNTNSGAGTLNQVSVFLRTSADEAALAFDPVQNFFVGLDARGLVVGDLNGDGKPDIATSDVQAQHNISLLTRTSTDGSPLTFASAVNLATGESTAGKPILLADADGDGKTDLIGNTDSQVIVFLRTSADGASPPQYATPGMKLAAGEALLNVTAVDLDADGKLDLIGAAAASDSNRSAIVFLRRISNDGAALQYAAAQLYRAGAFPAQLAIGDIDADGWLDIAAPNQLGPSVFVLTADDRNGQTGPTGATGPIGPQGATGADGPQGMIGATGPQGAAGPVGPQGADGSMGLQGLPGANGSAATPPAGAFILLPFGTPAPEGYVLIGSTKLRVIGEKNRRTTVTMDVYKQK